jgi:PAS domain-containing protein
MPLTRDTLAAIDFRSVFEKSRSLLLLLDTSFCILAVSDAYAAATMTVREKIVGHHLFEIFPDNPDYSHADGVSNLRRSLLKVVTSRSADEMPVQKYDIRRPDDGFEERYWKPVNWPILGDDGFVNLIVHQVEDVTENVRASSGRDGS